MPTTENYWNEDALTYTTDPREIKRDLETGRCDPRAVLTYIETLEESLDESSDAVDRLNECQAALADTEDELRTVESTLDSLRSRLDACGPDESVDAFRRAIAHTFTKPVAKKGRN